MILYHIAEKACWLSQAHKGIYKPEQFGIDGFIHCSTETQILEVANRFYKGKENLILLKIDANLITAPIIFENLEGSKEQFPHIYGQLNTNCVVGLIELMTDDAGVFSLSDVDVEF